MTDGNTGIQVAPITEDDMFKVQDILKRAANAIVAMSQLSADVDMLRQTVSGLQADADRLRNQNNALDEALNHSRAVRDEQARKLAEVEAKLRDAEQGRDLVLARNDSLVLQNDQLTIDLELVRKAKDDAEFHNLELEDELRAVKAKLAKVEDSFRAIFGEVKHEPTVVSVTEAVAPAPEPAPPTWDQAPPAPEPTPPIELATPTRRYLDKWEPGAIWDGEHHAYYIDHA